MKRQNNLISTILVYVGLIMGAGFASGQELLVFFVRYGKMGLWGLLLSCLCFSLVAYAVYDTCHIRRITSFRELCDYIGGKLVGRILELLVACFLFVILATMLAGGGAVAKQSLGLPPLIGVTVLAVLCLFVLLYGLDGILTLNRFLTPIMLLGTLMVGLISLYSENVNVFAASNDGQGWLLSSVLYGSYNTITAVAVLVSMSALLTTKRQRLWSSVISGIVILLLGLCICLPLYSDYVTTMLDELPMYTIAQNTPYLKYIYLFILISAIFTTAVANAFAFLDWLGMSSFLSKLLLVFGACVMASMGFSGLVERVYPLFGYLGLAELVLLFIGWCRCKCEKG